jgi:mannosylglycoprotein endo-beta-mannosidase
VFTEEEVWTAIKDMSLDKCPGPDGFSARFFITCWSIVKADVMEAFNSLSRLDSRGFGSINEAFVTLLPKKDGTEEVRDFRPISLTHGVAKLVAKVLANLVRLDEETSSHTYTHSNICNHTRK